MNKFATSLNLHNQAEVSMLDLLKLSRQARPYRNVQAVSTATVEEGSKKVVVVADNKLGPKNSGG